MKHRNIPFFVPHAGCPNACVFCSQVKITGKSIEKDAEAERCELEELLSSVVPEPDTDSRIAFFGGSFTAIDRARMTGLLEIADKYIEKGIASGIRISTRPDCIDDEILALLSEYRVTEIELGIQSTDDRVLELSGRGHTAKQSFSAAEKVVKKGFVLGGQMMTGLPGATGESEIQTARDIVSMGARESRIYPTVVFEGTELLAMTNRGEYSPLTTEEAVSRSAACLRIFLDAGVNVLRIGLHSSENLAEAPFGATHPSIGELVKGRMLADYIAEKCGSCSGETLCLSVGRSELSMLTGHGGAELKRLRELVSADRITLSVSEAEEGFPSVGIRRE